MSTFFKRIFAKKNADMPQMPQATEKSMQDEIVEQWKLNAPHRKDDCLEIARQLRELSNTGTPPEEKLSRASKIIQAKLNLYHLAIYRVQDSWLILLTGAGENIERMLVRGIKREVKPMQGIISHVAATQEMRLAWDLGPEDKFLYFQGPDLAYTNSEIVFPLLTGSKLIGVMDLQSIIRCDFRKEEHETFQILADCVADILAAEN